MPVRRNYLKNASVLLAVSALSVPALAPAQTPDNGATQSPTASGAKDTVLFDFEGGAYDGWTLTGDCWDKQPATTKTFVDRQGNPLVSGIVGKGYLTTLFKNAATTGKAVSKDFTIDKPFLTFRIGGGYYPKEACLNLVVDGKIVRSETGNDSAELVPAYWDVYALTGKTAHFEVVDTTANPNRGYVMVDDIQYVSSPFLVDTPLLSQYGVNPVFSSVASDFLRGLNAEIQRQISIPATGFEKAQDQIWVEVSRGVKFRSGETLLSLASRLKHVVERVCTSNELNKKNEFLKQWLCAEAVCAFTLLNVQYDYDVAKNNPGLTNGYKTGQVVLDMNTPKTICSGSALLTRDISRAMGIKCYYVGGWFREVGYNFGTQSTSNHAWVCYEFPNRILVPADTTTSAFHRDNYIKRLGTPVFGKLSRDIILPMDQAAWEVFLISYYAKDESPYRYGDAQGNHNFALIAFDKWKVADDAYLRPVSEVYRKSDRRRLP